MNILMVEDNEGDFMLAEQSFKRAELPVALTHFFDGINLVERILELPNVDGGALPDLILLDLNLPGPSGSELLIDIKAHEGTKHIPVVVFSSSRSRVDIEQAYRSNANSFISKPNSMIDYKDTAKAIFKAWQSATMMGSAVLSN